MCTRYSGTWLTDINIKRSIHLTVIFSILIKPDSLNSCVAYIGDILYNMVGNSSKNSCATNGILIYVWQQQFGRFYFPLKEPTIVKYVAILYCKLKFITLKRLIVYIVLWTGCCNHCNICTGMFFECKQVWNYTCLSKHIELIYLKTLHLLNFLCEQLYRIWG